jgi:large subunit ribosomal protein L43
MVSRGVHQLKNLRLYFCDYGGSSAGLRSMLQSEKLVDFVNKHEHIDMEIYMKRNSHPYVSATYINGYCKDIPLRKLTE